MKVQLTFELEAGDVTFDVTSEVNGKTLAHGRTTESIPRAFDLALADGMTKGGPEANLVVRVLEGIRKILPVTKSAAAIAS